MSRPVIAAVDPAHADVAPAALGFLLARLLGEPLLVATAYPVDPGVDNLSPEYSEQLARQAQEAVDRIAANVARGRRSGVAVTTRTFEVAGSTSAWLHRLAEHEGASVLVLGSSRRGSAGRVFPSAVTDRLLHGAPCPVAIAPAGFSMAGVVQGPNAIGVAFIDTPDGRAALAAAGRLAAAAHAREHVLVVSEPVTALMARMLTETQLEQARKSREAAAAATVERALGAIPQDREADATVLSGSVVEALAAASADLDLLVCGSRGHGPLRTLILGGTSHELVRNASCPVLVVPREGLGAAAGAELEAA